VPAGELNRSVIARAALTLVDREGLGALSMRRLGAELGVEGMAVYHHFANKDALLDEVVTEVLRQTAPEPTGDWRADVRALSHAFRNTVRAHPALLMVTMTRPVDTPETAAFREAQYAALTAAGLSGGALLDAHRTWGSYLVGYLVVEYQAEHSGYRDSDWTPTRRDGFPLTAGLSPYQAGRGWDEQFDVGLDLVLDGISALRGRSR
jgi:AcrR family transcriptional regulator